MPASWLWCWPSSLHSAGLVHFENPRLPNQRTCNCFFLEAGHTTGSQTEPSWRHHLCPGPRHLLPQLPGWVAFSQVWPLLLARAFRRSTRPLLFHVAVFLDRVHWRAHDGWSITHKVRRNTPFRLLHFISSTIGMTSETTAKMMTAWQPSWVGQGQASLLSQWLQMWYLRCTKDSNSLFYG